MEKKYLSDTPSAKIREGEFREILRVISKICFETIF